jgi:hypothetical protein
MILEAAVHNPSGRSVTGHAIMDIDAPRADALADAWSDGRTGHARRGGQQRGLLLPHLD